MPDKLVPFEFRLQSRPLCTSVCHVYLPCVLLCSCTGMFRHLNTKSRHLIRSALRASTMLRTSNAPGNGELFLDAMQSLTIICLPKLSQLLHKLSIPVQQSTASVVLECCRHAMSRKLWPHRKPSHRIRDITVPQQEWKYC